MSTIFSNFNVSNSRGYFNEFKLPVPSCPKLLFPHTQTFPYYVSAKEKFGPDSIFEIFYFILSGVIQLLVFEQLLPIPFNLAVPRTKALPQLLTSVVYYAAHETCFTLGTSIFMGQTSYKVYRTVSEVEIFLNVLLTLFNPQIYAQPVDVTAQICQDPQLT